MKLLVVPPCQAPPLTHHKDLLDVALLDPHCLVLPRTESADRVDLTEQRREMESCRGQRLYDKHKMYTQSPLSIHVSYYSNTEGSKLRASLYGR